MIQINEKLKKSIGTRDVDFDGYVCHILYPSFGGSDLTTFVNKKLGHIPKWGGVLRINRDENGILTSVENGPASITDEDAFFDFQQYRYDVSDEQVNDAYMEWFEKNGFPDAKIDPEGFIKRLSEIYPGLNDFIEIVEPYNKESNENFN